MFELTLNNDHTSMHAVYNVPVSVAILRVTLKPIYKLKAVIT